MFRNRPYTLLIGALACSLAASAQTNNATKRPVPRPGGLGNKVPELPANLFTAAGAVSKSPLKHEWVEIPAGKIKLHTWIHYPQGDGKAPVVLMMHYDAGFDDLQRAMADQLASEGFLVLAPDLTSGMGPKSGNFESFKFPDEALKAHLKVPAAEAMRRYRAAYDYAMKMPRSNGRVASVGCGLGGTYSFRFAAEAPKLDAAVVWYGAAPDAGIIAKIKAPVLGLYGGDDPVITPTVDATKDAMAKAGKTYEPHIYDGATNAFMTYQAEGGNGLATAQSWILAMEYLKEHLR
ncbi:MAG: dienelactone hydrolase family protein [Bryobacteraceae bacterium]